MRGNVSKNFTIGELLDIPLNDDILHATVVAGLSHGEAAEPAGPDVASQEQRVVGVRGTDSRNSNAGLGEDLVDGQSDHVLGLHGVDLVPFAVTELECVVRTEGGNDGTSTIVYLEYDGSIFHVKKQVISSSFNCS